MPETLIDPNSRDSRRIVRLGPLIATPDLLEAIPRSALGRAIRAHHYAAEGGRLQTRHSYEGILFRLRTDGDRTLIFLESER